MLHAAKAMAVAGAQLIQNPDLIAQAKAEFAASTRGRPYQSPIPAHIRPRTALAAD